MKPLPEILKAKFEGIKCRWRITPRAGIIYV
jgi:hypothetical protein